MKARDAAELVRLPAALTVPGDSLAGAAAARWPHGRATWGLPVASVCLYLAGMALNDFADQDLDAFERPERPIPSGRVAPAEALGLAVGLTAAGVGVAAVAGGGRALRVAVPLAATVWAYDLALARTSAGPAAMALARGLDVLLGAADRPARAALPALALACHTFGVTLLSRGEVHGGSHRSAKAALTTTYGAAALAVAGAAGRRPAQEGPRPSPFPPTAVGRAARVSAATVAVGGYAAAVGRAQAEAMRRPWDAGVVRAATGAGVRGCLALQSALLAGAGAPVAATVAAVTGPVARLASRVVSPT